MMILKFVLAVMLLMHFMLEIERAKPRPARILVSFIEIMLYLIIITQ